MANVDSMKQTSILIEELEDIIDLPETDFIGRPSADISPVILEMINHRKGLSDPRRSVTH